VLITSPETVSKLCSFFKPAPAGFHYGGCYSYHTKTVIAPADHRILLHELKHALEGPFHEEVKP